LKNQRELVVKKETVMGLWPSKKQWKSWTLPNKIGVIGGYAGIVAIPLSIFLFGLNYLLQPNSDDIVRRIAAEHEAKLNKQYPTAHTVFGVYQNRDIVPMGQMPENLKIDWTTGKVQSTNNNVLMVTLPDMILNGKSFVSGNVTRVEKRIGAKSGSIIKLGWFNPILEVIGIDDDLVVVALGFPADDSKK
jgi:hypothetical protein